MLASVVTNRCVRRLGGLVDSNRCAIVTNARPVSRCRLRRRVLQGLVSCCRGCLGRSIVVAVLFFVVRILIVLFFGNAGPGPTIYARVFYSGALLLSRRALLSLRLFSSWHDVSRQMPTIGVQRGARRRHGDTADGLARVQWCECVWEVAVLDVMRSQKTLKTPFHFKKVVG